MGATLAWIEDWRSGAVPLTHWLAATDEARRLFAELLRLDVAQVATGTSVAQLVGLLAASLPADALVLSSDDEFASLLHPFLAQADRGVRVETVPRGQLPAAAAERGDVVAFSLVNADDGTVVDHDALVDAARSRSALTIVDAAQAAGWLQFDCARFDVVVVPAFKWLCSPRGTAFMVVQPEHLEWLRPVAAGWWPSLAENRFFGGPLRLPPTAKRLDSTPAWTAWPGTAAALRVLTGFGIEAIGSHALRLAARLREGLALPPERSAIVVTPDRGAAGLLADAGIVAASTPKGTRLSVHLYNDEDDVDAVLEALGGTR